MYTAEMHVGMQFLRAEKKGADKFLNILMSSWEMD